MRQVLLTMTMLMALGMPAMAEDQPYESSGATASPATSSDPAMADPATLSTPADTAVPPDVAREPESLDADASRTADLESDSERLPRTASPLPLLALIGGTSLAGALGLRRLRGRS